MFLSLEMSSFFLSFDENIIIVIEIFGNWIKMMAQLQDKNMKFYIDFSKLIIEIYRGCMDGYC